MQRGGKVLALKRATESRSLEKAADCKKQIADDFAKPPGTFCGFKIVQIVRIVS